MFEVQGESTLGRNNYIINEMHESSLGTIIRQETDLKLATSDCYITSEIVIAFLMFSEEKFQRKVKNGEEGTVRKFPEFPPEIFKFIFDHLIWRWFKWEYLLRKEREAEMASTDEGKRGGDGVNEEGG